MFLTLLKKELFVEFRTREITISMIVFGLAIILTFAFSSNVGGHHSKGKTRCDPAHSGRANRIEPCHGSP